MVFAILKRFLSNHKERQRDKVHLESFKETEEMRKAEDMKREADRLASLKQYKVAINEYIKALEYYPLKGNEEELFQSAADFLFKCNYNIAACYSYLDNFDQAIGYFDSALGIKMANDENKVKAHMGKGSTFYRKKLFLKGQYKSGAYKISMDSDYEISEKLVEEFKDQDRKKSFIKSAHECFDEAVNFDRSNQDAYYSKGHMEVMMGQIKEAVQSFDNVLSLNKSYSNKESIALFDEIRREKGIQVKPSEMMSRNDNSEPIIRTKTGHLVSSRAEAAIANFLFDHNLIFQYNSVATWAEQNDFRPSFYIPKLDLYIDHHPFDYIKEYQKAMNVKEKQYEKFKKKHVSLGSEDETNLDEALRLKLKPYAIF
jgi:tetratricopeptide (TPR) repeat protein